MSQCDWEKTPVLLKKQVKSVLDLCVLIGVVQLILIGEHLSSVCRKMSFSKKPSKLKWNWSIISLSSTFVVVGLVFQKDFDTCQCLIIFLFLKVPQDWLLVGITLCPLINSLCHWSWILLQLFLENLPAAASQQSCYWPRIAMELLIHEARFSVNCVAVLWSWWAG